MLLFFYVVSQSCCRRNISSAVIFGRFNFGINVYENGYVFTNLVECGAEFFISPEKAQELIEYYS